MYKNKKYADPMEPKWKTWDQMINFQCHLNFSHKKYISIDILPYNTAVVMGDLSTIFWRAKHRPVVCGWGHRCALQLHTHLFGRWLPLLVLLVILQKVFPLHTWSFTSSWRMGFEQLMAELLTRYAVDSRVCGHTSAELRGLPGAHTPILFLLASSGPIR